MDSTLVNGKKVLNTLPAIIDTGTTLIIGDPKNVAKFYAAIPNSRPAPEILPGLFACNSLLYLVYEAFLILLMPVPCNSKHTVALSFANKPFPIDPNLFN